MPIREPVPSAARRPGLAGLEQRLLARCRALALPPNAYLVVGFSGGADSLALAAALGRIAAAAEVQPVLVHVDHALREGSNEEQRRAAASAAALGVPFRAARVPDGTARRHPGVGPEEAARRERYRALSEAAGELGAQILVLAHHREDQAETVLLHLLRGGGLAGATGMAELAETAVPWWELSGAALGLRVWRPFLTEARADVRAYALATGVDPIEDPTNDDRAFRRNAIRHEALPLLEKIAPGATAALARFGRLAADDDAALEALAEAVLLRVTTADGGLRRDLLTAETPAVRRRVVRRWLRAGTGFRSLTADRTEAVLGLIERGEGGRWIEIGDGWGVLAREGTLHVEPLPWSGMNGSGEGGRG